MKNNTKLNLLKGAVATATLLVATSASAFTMTVGGIDTADGTGLHSSVGWMENTFDAANAFGTYTNLNVVNGSENNQYVAPPGDKSNYANVYGSTSPMTLKLDAPASYFGYFGGSPDYNDRNVISFYWDNTLIKSYNGNELAAKAGFPADGNPENGAYWNFFAEAPNEYFNVVKFFASTNSFETDNHAVNAVPLPAAAWLFGSALLGFAGFSNRRKA